MSPSRRRRRRASPEWEGRRPIAVATLPGRGLYARHLGHPEGVDGVHRVTVAPTATSSRPPCAFDRTWLEQHIDAVDLVHVHGVPARSTAEDVRAAVQVVRRAGRPLVATAYHLSDPGGEDDDRYRAQLDVLLPAADAVVTLTASAADEIRRRWGLEAVVLPHPHAVDFVRMRQERPRWRRGEFVVGTHLAGLRGPAEPVALVGALAAAVRRVPDARLVVHLHENVLDPGSSCFDLKTVRALDGVLREAKGTLRAHRPFTESQLWDHLFGLDVSVVPGLRGSHSVWPEACHDLGTQAMLPAGTHAAEQRPCLRYELSDGVPDVDSLAEVLTVARDQGCLWRADPAERWKERVFVAESLRALYEGLCGVT